MLAELELFFAIRSQWMVDGRLDALARMHILPAAFYHREKVQFASTPRDLHRIFRNLQDDLLRDGIVRLRPRVGEPSSPVDRTFPVIVEYQALDRFNQIISFWKIRYYLRDTGSEGFKVEMMEDLEIRPVTPRPQPPYASRALH